MPMASIFSVRAEDTGAAGAKAEDWLLISNCQAMGLANCLNLVTDEVRVEHYHPAGFQKSSRDILRRWDTFARVLVAPQLLHMLPEKLQKSERIWLVPTFSFSAYHPDICYLRSGGKALKGPLDDYHSTIAYAGYKLGMSVEEVSRHYHEATYARLGYFDRWDGAKNQLLEKFEQAGFDLRAAFANWTRMGAFMYSVNHVKVRCLMDVAKAILERAGKHLDYLEELPHDNLMFGPVFPIYPEIGRRLGVRGNYLFKLGATYGFIRLGQFLDESYSVYDHARDSAPIPEHSSMIERAMRILGSSS